MPHKQAKINRGLLFVCERNMEFIVWDFLCFLKGFQFYPGFHPTLLKTKSPSSEVNITIGIPDSVSFQPKK